MKAGVISVWQAWPRAPCERWGPRFGCDGKALRSWQATTPTPMLGARMPSIITAVRDLERLRQIAGVLARHGFGELVQRTGLSAQLGLGKRPDDEDQRTIGLGERIRLVLTELGPSFVKLGQIVSTRGDVIPADIIDELRKLQDEVPGVPFEQVKPVLEQDLGATVGEVYEWLDEEPFASASIAQVHRARLKQ